MNFDLKKPCAQCPFRSDIRPFLTKGRVREILHGITAQNQTFTCHKHLHGEMDEDDEDDEDEVYIADHKDQHCAGALILLEKIGHSNQMMRISERIGLYDRTKLHMDEPVFNTPDAMILAQPR